MDHLRALRNLWWFTVGCAIAWCSMMPLPSHAYPASPPSGTAWRLNQHGNFSCGTVPASQYVYGSAAAACAAANMQRIAEQAIGGCNNAAGTAGTAFNSVGAMTSPSPLTYACRYDIYWSGSLQMSNATIGGGAQQGASQAYTCPNGGTLSGTTCTCPVGWTDTGTGCDQTPVTCTYPQTRDAATNTCKCPTNGTKLDSISIGPAPVAVEYGANDPRPNSGCFGGCNVSYDWPSVSIAAKQDDGNYISFVDRTRVTFGTGTCTVTPTSPTQDPSPTPTDKTCPQGFVWGEVNNVGGCYPGGTKTDGSGTASNTKTNPDGTTTTTTVNVTENTICTGAGACTTTTVTSTTITNRDAQGNVTGTTTDNKTETKPGDGTELGAFCAKNPKANICKGAGGDEKADSFGGSCPASFTCEGDAVTCAIAQEQHKRNCEFFTPYGAESRKTTAQTLVDNAFNGTGLGENFVPRGDPIQAGTLNTGERINAGSCPAPTQIATPLGTFTLDFTNLCPWFAFFGNIVLFACLLIAAKITIGGIVGSA